MTATVIRTNGINNNNGQTKSSNGNNNNNNNSVTGSSASSSSSNAMSFTTTREMSISYSSSSTVSASASASLNNANINTNVPNNCKTSNTLKNFSSFDTTGGTSFTSTNLFQLLSITCMCLISFYNSTQCGLVFDDISAIRDNKDLRPTTPLKNIFLNDFWGTPMRKEHSHKSYRPLTVLTFRFNYWLHELNSYGYHFVNVILHIAVCLLWKRVSRILVLQCTQRERLAVKCSFLSTLLFAVHPIHTEAVTGVVGRAELLSSIFFLGSFLAYSRAVSGCINSAKKSQKFKTQWVQMCVHFSLSLLASMLCKEQGITIAGICVAYELFVVQTIHPLQLWHTLLNIFEERPASTIHTPSPTNKAANTKLLQSSTISTLAGATSTSSANYLTTKPSVSCFRTPIQWSSTLLKRLGFLTLITVCLLVGRVYIMGSQLPVFTRFDNPASAAESPSRQLTYSYLIYLNAWLLLFPCDLCCDWTMGTVPLVEGLWDIRNVATIITFIILVALVVKSCLSQTLQHSRMLIMCLAWIVFPFLPASNLFFPVGFVVAERILYMPSMGFCLLIAYGYEKSKEMSHMSNSKLQYFLKASFLILLLTHISKSYQRNKDWLNEYTLFMSGVHVNERNAKLFNNVGHALESEGNFQEALSYFQQAVVIQPDDIGAHINVGRTYNNLKMYTEAEKAYLKAKSLFPRIKPGESYQARIAPYHLNVFINLASLIARNQTRLEEADFLYRQAISMRADYVQAYINRGDILMKLNRTLQAQEVYEKALLYDSENADIHYNLGVVFLEQGKSAQANVYFDKALQLYPEHEQALLNSAILLQEIGGVEARKLSRERLHKILMKNSENEKVFFNLGMLAMDESDFDAAEQYFKRAIHIKENFRSALFNLALLLADANRPLDAVPFLNQLIRHHPDHIKGLILLGDIYINHMKDLDAAESCYRSILKYAPHNIQGLHNLCVVFVERKHLARAQSCLRFAYYLAPTEDYILRHLQIVEQRLQKIYKLPDTSPEKKLALVDFNPKEFPLPIKTSTSSPTTSPSTSTVPKKTLSDLEGDLNKESFDNQRKTPSSSASSNVAAAAAANLHQS